MKHHYVALCILVIFPSLLAAVNYTFSEPVTNIAVDTHGQVLVTSGKFLHSLSSQLQLSSSFDFGNVGMYSLVAGLTVHGSATIIACLAPGSTCAVFDPQQNSDKQLLSQQEPVYTNGIDSKLSPLALVSTEGKACFAAGSGQLPIYKWIKDNVMFLSRFTYENSTNASINSWQWQKFIITKSGFYRDIVGGFEYNDMIYFIAQDSTPTGRTVSVIRTCNQGELDEHAHTPFSAVYEVTLSSVPLNATSAVVHVQLTRNFAQVPVDLLVITISSESSGNNGIYAVRMSDINNRMNAMFRDCKKKGPSKNLTFTPPWSHVEIDCDDFGEQSSVAECDFMPKLSRVSILYADNPGPSYSILSLQQPDGVLTASLVMELCSTTFLHIAFTNATGSYLSKYLVIGSTEGILSADEVLLFNHILLHTVAVSQPVMRLVQGRQGDDALYAVTEDMVFKMC